jgi:hypothetical protein
LKPPASPAPSLPPASGRASLPLDPELPTRHVTSTKVVAVRGAELEVRDDLVVGEEPLQIRAAGPRQLPVEVAVTMRTRSVASTTAIPASWPSRTTA